MRQAEILNIDPEKEVLSRRSFMGLMKQALKRCVFLVSIDTRVCLGAVCVPNRQWLSARA